MSAGLHLNDQATGGGATGALRQTTTVAFDIPAATAQDDKLLVTGGNVRLFAIYFLVTTDIENLDVTARLMITSPGLSQAQMHNGVLINGMVAGSGYYIVRDTLGNINGQPISYTDSILELEPPQQLLDGSVIAFINDGPDSPTGQGRLVAVWQPITVGASIDIAP